MPPAVTLPAATLPAVTLPAATLIDSHCHLDYFEPEEVAGLVSRAATAGVTEMVTIGTRFIEADRQIALADAYPNVWCTIGVHPHNAAEHPVPSPDAIAAKAAHPRVVGIGESGLDHFYDKSPRDVQEASFRAHIRAARQADLPLVIHARDADDDVARVLSEETTEGGSFLFLLHCFSSTRALADAAIALGGYISLSGILTFPKSQELRQIAADVPADRLLVETDSPFLAPVPFRGKRNEPAYTAKNAAVLGEVRGLNPAEIADLTTQNFRRLFRKATA